MVTTDILDLFQVGRSSHLSPNLYGWPIIEYLIIMATKKYSYTDICFYNQCSKCRYV